MAAVIEPLENALDAFGLMRGETAPMKRFLVGSSVTLAALWLAKPSIMFDESGEPRAWSAVSDDRNATSLPVYVPALLSGFVLSTFI